MRGHGLEKSRRERVQVAGCPENDNEKSKSIKSGEFLD